MINDVGPRLDNLVNVNRERPDRMDPGSASVTTRSILRHLWSIALAAALPGCQPCLEFECIGGFTWNGQTEASLEPGDYTLDVRTDSATHAFACTIDADATLSACAPMQRRDPVTDEHATITLSEAAAGFAVTVYTPTNTSAERTDAEGPDEVSVAIRSANGTRFEETYRPDYAMQDRGEGCGVCQHSASVQATLAL